MKGTAFSHQDGAIVIPRALQEELSQIINQIRVKVERGAASSVREALIRGLLHHGWAGEVALNSSSKITITSSKSGVGLCLQTGNISRMYADLLKLQKLYLDSSIVAGVMIVPSHPCAKVLGDNLANATRLEAELSIFAKVITVPILLLSIE